MDRLSEIKEKVSLWFQFKLCASVDDIMPDIVYLLSELEKLQHNSTKDTPQ